MAERHQLTRKKLYDLVWEKPITHLAKEYGTSSYQLIKICRAHRIPTPICGYWSKLKHNKDVPKRPLSENSDLDKKPIVIVQVSESHKTKRKQKIKETVYVKSPIHITKRLNADQLHPIVVKTLKTGFKMERQIYGLQVPIETCLDVTVTSETIRRSLLLADTIIKAVVARGYRFEVVIEKKMRWPSDRDYETEICYFNIKGERVRFAIIEKINQVQRPLTEEEKAKLKSGGYVFDRLTYFPSGKLKVKIKEAYYRNNTWMDNDKNTVEEQMPQIVKAILKAADEIKKTRIQEKIENCRRAEEERQAELKRLLKKQEKQRIHDLIIQVKKWKKAVAIRNYLNAFEEAMGTDEYRDHGMKYWLDWAYGYADQVDPLTMFSK